MRLAELVDFLRSRSVEPASVQPLPGGEKNLNWLVSGLDGRRFALRCYRLSSPREVEYELHAVAHLAEAGFPTPAPVPTTDGVLPGTLNDRPAALFPFVDGVGGDESDDPSLGLRAAAMAGRMHVLCGGDRTFPGEREAWRDPLAQIQRFLDSPYASRPALHEATSQLQAQVDKMATAYAEPDGLRQGLVHNDISSVNLLLDKANGDIVALIDFDDCLTSFQLYDLGRIVELWGRRPDRRADLARIAELVQAYDAARPLTAREWELAVDFIATSAAATGVHVLTNWLRAGREVSDPRTSHSMLLFLDLAGQSRLSNQPRMRG